MTISLRCGGFTGAPIDCAVRHLARRSGNPWSGGQCLAAFHGLLRTAHAYRGWQRHPSAARRIELAHGLGYWAARHQRLPGEPGRRAQSGLGPAEVLAAVELVPAPQGGLILERFAVLEQRPEFVALVEAFDPDAREVDVALDEIVSVAARGYLAASDAGRRFVYLHGITSTAAIRNLLPVLAPAQGKLLVAHQVAAIAAVHATHGEVALPEPARGTAGVDWAELVARASTSTDDHTIKLVEACASEARRGACPELAAVARDRLGA